MSGRKPRRKGDRAEREIVQLHRDMGIPAVRVPLSGSVGGSFSGDVQIRAFGMDVDPLVAEVKARASGGGFVQIEKWLGTTNDALFLRRDRCPPMVVLPWRTWKRLLAAI